MAGSKAQLNGEARERSEEDVRSARAFARAEMWHSPLRGTAFFMRAWALIPVVHGSLRWLGFDKTVRWVERVPARKRLLFGGEIKTGVSPELGERLVAMAYRAHLISGNCLPRSLVQVALHRRDGTPANFVVGVRKVGANDRGASRIEAHAWVERPGRREHVGFAPIFNSAIERTY
ncbi:MAG: lasso peptide biosynthesis B2 protein [Polyangiaceae bacterium]|nr:lasso peptide biosynthesis B2 protein [Polyangiaceae bacterium]